MIDVSIKITAPPGKRKEVLQTFKALLGPIRREQGCVGCNCYLDLEGEEVILFTEEWGSREELDTHLRSVHFGVLIGVMKLLTTGAAIRFNTIASTAGAEAITEARSCR